MCVHIYVNRECPDWPSARPFCLNFPTSEIQTCATTSERASWMLSRTAETGGHSTLSNVTAQRSTLAEEPLSPMIIQGPCCYACHGSQHSTRHSVGDRRLTSDSPDQIWSLLTRAHRSAVCLGVILGFLCLPFTGLLGAPARVISI